MEAPREGMTDGWFPPKQIGSLFQTQQHEITRSSKENERNLAALIFRKNMRKHEYTNKWEERAKDSYLIWA